MASDTLFDLLPVEIIEIIDKYVTRKNSTKAWDWVLINNMNLGDMVARRYDWKSNHPLEIGDYCVICGVASNTNRCFPKFIKFDETVCMLCAKKRKLIIPVKHIPWQYPREIIDHLISDTYCGSKWVKAADAFNCVLDFINNQVDF